MKKILILLSLLSLLPLPSLTKNTKEEIKSMDNTNNIEINVLNVTSSKQDHPINLLQDNDFSTFWEALDTTNQTIVFDLNEVKSLKNVTQVFSQDDIWYFTIEASIDNKEFFTLLDNSFGVYGQTFSESISGFARYIKLTIIKSEKGFNPSSKEFYVEATSLEEGDNISLGLKGDASSQQGNYSAKNAYDGDYGTFWCASTGNYPQWLSGEWQNTVYAKSIELTLQDYGNYIFGVQIRDTNGTWIEIEPISLKTGNYFKYNIEREITALIYNVTGGPGWANMAQIKVNGFEDVTSLVGKEDIYVNYISNNTSEYEYSLDSINYTSTSSNKLNKIIRNIKGLSTGAKVFGYPVSKTLNINFDGKMSSYINESHHISAATISNRNIDYAKTYYQAENKGEQATIEFNLGKECLINGFTQEFLTNKDHKFLIETSNDNTNYDIAIDLRNNTTSKQVYECVLDNSIKARYVKVTFFPKEDEYASSRRFAIHGNGSSKRENWWQDTSGVIRFYPKEQKTTLREITSRLDEFRYSGYRVIELHQPYEGKADIWAGLGATNNYQVDPIIGNLNDLTYLLREAHKKGIKVFMFGNVGYAKADSDLFIKAQRDYALGINSRESKYFLFSKNCPDPTKWFWSDIANAYYYGYWGEDGQIPTYNFENVEWQEETYNYIKFWSTLGFDGIALDAPDVYYYGSSDSASITFKTITSTLRKQNLFSLPEGSGNTGFISNFKYCGVQNYGMTSWGAGALSLGLCAAQKHTAERVDDYVKSVRDTAVSLKGIAIDGMNFEDVYDEASTSERILESALVTTTGHMAFLHIGSSSKIGQDMMNEWPINRQLGVAKSFALQNSLSSLNASGERAWLSTNSDYRYYAFYRSNMNSNNKSLVVFNYQDYPTDIQIDLSGSPLNNKSLTLYDAYNDEQFTLNVENGVITLPMKANSHRVLIVR